jgi:hypothetical protein
MQKLSAGMTHLITLAEDLPIGQIQYTCDIIGGKLGDANKVILSALSRLGDLVDPVVPSSYPPGRLNEALGILRGVRVLEDHERIPGLGQGKWMGFMGGSGGGRFLSRLDLTASNYGCRLDLILCFHGMDPWKKHQIQSFQGKRSMNGRYNCRKNKERILCQ